MYRFSCLSRFNENLIFSTDFRKIPKCQIAGISVQWEPICSMRTDGEREREGRKGMTNPLVAFRNFMISPKEVSFHSLCILYYTHTHTYIYIHTYIHTHTYAHTHTHTHTHTHAYT